MPITHVASRVEETLALGSISEASAQVNELIDLIRSVENYNPANKKGHVPSAAGEGRS